MGHGPSSTRLPAAGRSARSRWRHGLMVTIIVVLGAIAAILVPFVWHVTHL